MPFSSYLAQLKDTLKTGQATEPSYYPALKDLLEALEPGVTVTQNPKKTEHGSPDFSVKRKKHVHAFPVGWIEAKEPGEDLGKIEKSDQLKRYLHLPNLVLTDFLEFRWYTSGQRRLTARLARLDDAKLSPDPKGEVAVRDLLLGFLAHSIPPTRNSRELARVMARLAHFIRDATLYAFEREPEAGKLHNQLQAFRETLIPDLSPDQFADMYAQTIAYGLFAAACQPRPATEAFTREKAAYLIPKTNPFLRKLFNEIAGPELDPTIQPFVDDLVALLRESDLNSILADFGKRAGKEDPVVHFYEDFLQAYDPKVRELRGVYYTPEPVVSYIVRSIDHLLKTRFNKPDGLADKDVLILDPACGTGTFLYYVIRHIYDTLCAKGQKGAWNSYVSQNLLKRIFGFELLMAPYAVAHLKLGLLLQELGYRFDSDERLGIYLTNTLDEAIKKSELIFAQWIADEANAAAEIKKEKPIMVVLGNPPYSGHSANRSWTIQEDPKTKKQKKVLTFIGKLLQDYYKVDGKPLGEKNPKWLQDDYVKFIRFAQWRINKTGYGILAYISNNGYLDNPTFRGLRQQLLAEFNDVYLLDLHGSTKKKERAPDGGKDENVFDIQQGVGIGVFVKQQGYTKQTAAYHANLWGGRQPKYDYLDQASCNSTPWQEVQPASPSYLFVPREADLEREYERGWKLNDIFPVNSVGIVTARDRVSICWSREEIHQTAHDFASLQIEEIRQKYDWGGDAKDWKLADARRDIADSGPNDANIAPILYRPFDLRYTYYTGNSLGFIVRPRQEVMRHMLGGHNRGLIVPKRVETSGAWTHVLAANHIIEHVAVSLKTIDYLFPLHCQAHAEIQRNGQMQLGTAPSQTASNPNLEQHFVETVKGALGRDPAPEEIFNYIYAVLHSPKFRARYAKFLKTDLPRVPLTSDKKLLRTLCEKGAELVSLHLMESLKLNNFITRYEQPGDHGMEKVSYDEKKKRVYINKTQYFEGVPKEVWEFHIGGYQVCQKWLKDRKGRNLSADDIAHYQRVVVALNETIRLMREIDEIIPGWPLP